MTGIRNDSDNDTLKGLEESVQGPSATNSGSKTQAERQQLQDMYDAPPARRSGSDIAQRRSGGRPGISAGDARAAKNRRAGTMARQSARRDPSNKTATNLADQEADATDKQRPSNVRDRLNKGYTGNKDKKTLASKLWHSNSNRKKLIGIGGAAAGGAGMIAMLFVSLLPLKIEFLITNIEKKYMAASMSAMDQEAGNVFNRYVVRSIIPSIFADECQSTIDPGCKVTPEKAKGIFGSLFSAWSDGNLEYALATQDPSIVLGREGQGSHSFYISIDGERIGNDKQFQELREGKITIFDLNGTKSMPRGEIRYAVKQAMRNSTKWNRVYTRYKMGELLERKYGIKRCVVFCQTRDKAADFLADKKLAGKSFLIQRIMSEKYSIILECVLAGPNGSCDPSKLEPATPGEPERSSPFQRQLNERMVSYAATYGKVPLKELVKTAEDISKQGLEKYLAKAAVAKVVGAALGDATGAAAADLAEKAIPVVGQVLLIAKVISTAGSLGPVLAVAAYQLNAATAVQLLETYKTVVAECKSSHCDMAILGSFAGTLSTSISGDPNHSVDVTQSGMVQQLLSGHPSGISASFLSSILPGTAWAMSPDEGKNKYLCDDGKPVPSGQRVCDEMVFRENGNEIATQASEIVTAVPGATVLADWVTTVGDAPGEWVADGLEYVPGYSDFAEWTASAVPMDTINDALITKPQVDSGARQGEMMMVGADIAGNAGCRILLGCAEVSHKAMAEIQNAQLAEDRAEFEAMPMFARIFSTSTSYSLVARMAIAMPGNFSSAASSGIAAILTSPFERLASVFASTLAGNTAFASPFDGEPDPFKITQYAHLNIPDDPVEFSDNNCISGPLAIYNESAQTYDYSAWLNQQQIDTETGDAIAAVGNLCMLGEASAQSMGTTSSIKLMPPGSANPD